MLSLWLALACVVGHQASALPSVRSSGGADDNKTHNVQVVHQYPPGSWVENLALRPNGKILPVLVTSPVLNQVDPWTGSLTEIYDFSSYGNAMTGIVKLRDDIFVVDVSNGNLSDLANYGPWSSWTVHFRGHHDENATVTKIATYPRPVGLLNGMAALNPDLGLVIIADSFLGGVWLLDTEANTTTVAFTDESMMAVGANPIGINGIRYRNGTLWFINAAAATLNRIAIDPVTGQKKGNAVVVARNLTGADDFELDQREQNAYVAIGPANQILKVPTNGGAPSIFAEVPGPTSVRWGPMKAAHIAAELYVSANGGALQYQTGNFTNGGSVDRTCV